MNWKNASCTLVVSLTAVLGASSAMGMEYCYEGKVCSKTSDACHGGLCVPKDRLCKTDAGCKGWQVCDMTCPGGGSSGGGTTTPGTGTGCASSDGDACVSSPEPMADASGGSDAGGAGKPKSDSGSADQAFAPDAGAPPQADASQPSTCPKDQGVCIVDAKKVAPQPGCAEFCKSVVTCDFLGNSGSGGGGGGGGGGSDPGQPPPVEPTDGGGSGAPQPKDAGSTGEDPMPDVMGAKQNPDASGLVAPDAGPNPKEIEECVYICSVWKLEGVAQPEFNALTQCVAGKAGVCNEMNLACKDAGESFEKAAKANDFWMIATKGMGSNGATTGTGENQADATGSSDIGSAPRAPDAKTAGDAVASTGTAGGGSNSSSSGCTAGPTAHGTPWGIALLSLLGLGMLFRRHRAA